MRLAELQQAVQAHLLAGGEPPSALVASVRPPAVERWRIYSDAYRVRLVEALAKGFPAFARRLGERTFGALILDFVAAQPSVHRSVRDYGGELEGWLRAEAADAEGAEFALLADLAAFERALAGAFDGADASPVTRADLVAVPPEEWGSLRFAAAPCVRRVRLGTNAVEAWREALAHEAGADLDAPAAAQRLPTSTWLVWRVGLDLRYRELDTREAAALEACLAGLPFGEFCAALEATEGEAAPLQAATWIAAWTAEGLLVRP